MEKKLLLLSNVILLSSCNVFVNNSLPNEKKTIVGDFGNIVKDKVTITDENGHDFSNQKLMVKGTLNDTVDHLIIGDEVEIYYKDDSKTEIDHVFVIPAKVVAFTYVDQNPCETSNDYNFYSDEFEDFSNGRYETYNIKNIINEDFTYFAKEKINEKISYYGSYQESDIEVYDESLNANNSFTIIYIRALFTYNPR